MEKKREQAHTYKNTKAEKVQAISAIWGFCLETCEIAIENWILSLSLLERIHLVLVWGVLVGQGESVFNYLCLSYLGLSIFWLIVFQILIFSEMVTPMPY